jgi:hypothetical protein
VGRGEGGASEGQGDKKSRGWLHVFIQFTHLRICLGQQRHTPTRYQQKMRLQRKLRPHCLLQKHVNKVGKRREIIFLIVALIDLLASPPPCLPCRARTTLFLLTFIFLVVSFLPLLSKWRGKWGAKYPEKGPWSMINKKAKTPLNLSSKILSQVETT